MHSLVRYKIEFHLKLCIDWFLHISIQNNSFLSCITTKIIKKFKLNLQPNKWLQSLLWWLSSNESTCNVGEAGDVSSIPGLGKYPGGEHGNPLQHSFQARKIPWTEEPDRLQTIGWQRARHVWSDWAQANGYILLLCN